MKKPKPSEVERVATVICNAIFPGEPYAEMPLDVIRQLNQAARDSIRALRSLPKKSNTEQMAEKIREYIRVIDRMKKEKKSEDSAAVVLVNFIAKAECGCGMICIYEGKVTPPIDECWPCAARKAMKAESRASKRGTK